MTEYENLGYAVNLINKCKKSHVKYLFEKFTFKFKSAFINKQIKHNPMTNLMSKLPTNDVQLKVTPLLPPKRSPHPTPSLVNTNTSFRQPNFNSQMISSSQPTLKKQPETNIQGKKIDNSTLILTSYDESSNPKPFVPLALPFAKYKRSIAGPDSNNSRSTAQENSQRQTSSNLNQAQIQKKGSRPNIKQGVKSSKSQSKGPKAKKTEKETQNKIYKQYTASNSTRDLVPKPKKAVSEENKVPNQQKLNVVPQIHTKKPELPPKIQIQPKTPAQPLQTFKTNVPPQLSPERDTSLDRSQDHFGRRDRSKTRSPNKPFLVGTATGTKSNISLGRVNGEKTGEKRVDRSVVDPQVDEMIKTNAMRYLVEIKITKEQKELEKRWIEERKMAMDEGNKKIRESNFKRFSLGTKENKPSFPWGIDQRKFNPNSLKKEDYGFDDLPLTPKKRNPLIYLDDKERRKQIGLDNLDNQTIDYLRKKSAVRISNPEQSHESIKIKKTTIPEEERARLQVFIMKKKEQMVKESEYKKLEDLSEHEKRRRNLEVLMNEIKETRDKLHLRPKKKSKKMKSKQTSKENFSSGKPSKGANKIMVNNFMPIKESDDENYNMLYNEYQKIKQVKLGKPEGTPNKNVNVMTEDNEENKSRQNASYEKRKQDMQRRFTELADRFHRIQHSEGGSAQKHQSQHFENRTQTRSKQTHQTSENDRNEGQQAIIEMETSNFSDNDYLRSDSLVIREGEGHEREDEETEERSSTKQGNYNDDSLHEIREAAATFIQKNYRGYRTRRLLKTYFYQLCEAELARQEMEESGGEVYHGDQNGHDYHHKHHQQYKHQDEDEEQNDYHAEDEDDENGEEQNPEDEPDYDEIVGDAFKRKWWNPEDEELRAPIFVQNQEKNDAQNKAFIQGRVNPQQHHLRQPRTSHHPTDEFNKRGSYDENQLQDEEEDDQVGIEFHDDNDQLIDFYGQGEDEEEQADHEFIDPRDNDEQVEEEAGNPEQREEGIFESDQKKNIMYLLEKQRKALERKELEKRAQENHKHKQPSKEQQYMYESSHGKMYQDQYDNEDEDGIEYQDQYFDNRYKQDIDNEPLENQFQASKKKKPRSDGDAYEKINFDEIEGEMDGDEYSQEIDPRRVPQNLHYQYGENHDLDVEEEGYPEDGEYVHDGEYYDEEHQEDALGEDVDENIKEELERLGNEDIEGEYEDEWEDGNNHPELHRHEDEKLVLVSTIHSDEDVEALLASGDGNIPSIAQMKDKIQLPQPPGNRKEDFMKTEDKLFKADKKEQRPFFQSPALGFGESDKKSIPELLFRETGEHGNKSLITVGEFGEEEKMTTFGASPDMLTKKLHSKSGSDYFRERLIEELNSFGQREQGQKDDETDPGRSQSQSSHMLSQNDISGLQGNDKSVMHKTMDLTTILQSELAKLQGEQVKKWEEMISQLNILQKSAGIEVGKHLNEIIQNLQKQSEMNKRLLLENAELQNLIKTTQPSEMDTLLKNFGTISIGEKQPHSNTYTPQESKNTSVIDLSISSNKKAFEQSPTEMKFKGKKKMFQPKKRLQIDIETINDEAGDNDQNVPLPPSHNDHHQHKQKSNNNQHGNIDLTQMRLVMPSEQLLRSARSASVETPRDRLDDEDLGDTDQPESQSQEITENSIFSKDPFKDFTNKKFKELLQQDNMRKLILMREQALEKRHQTHVENLKQMLEHKRVSPRTFQHKKIELEKWITKEKETLQKSKREIERGWMTAMDALKRTQRDLEFLTRANQSHTPGEWSLRNSLTDEDGSIKAALRSDNQDSEYVESKSEKLIRKPQIEIRSPTTAGGKSIKIIDKFEFKDTMGFKRDGRNKAFSDKGGEMTSSYELKRTSDDFMDSGELFDQSLGSTLKDSQTLGRKLKELGIEREEGEVEFEESGNKDSGKEIPEEHEIYDPKKGDPNMLTRQNFYQPNKDYFADQRKGHAEGDHQVSDSNHSSPDYGMSPERSVIPRINKSQFQLNLPTKPEKADNEKQTVDANPSQLKSPHMVSPKSPQELQQMFDDLKKVNDENNLKNIELVYTDETSSLVSPQAQADRIAEEIIQGLISELENEELSGSKKHISDKLRKIEPNQVNGKLQNLIENNNLKSPTSEKQPDKAQIHAKETHKFTEQEIQAQIQQDLFKSLSIKTTMEAVSKYLDFLIDEIKNSSVFLISQSIADYRNDFLRVINTPIGLSAAEKLGNMHAYDTMQSESSLEMSGVQQAILTIELYLRVENKILNDVKAKNEISVELEHIHNKMIFDSLNEILDSFRPFGFMGQPYPWKNTVKVNKPKPITEKTLPLVLEKGRKKVIEWAAMMCGYFGDHDEFLADKTNSFCDEYLSSLKEERLMKMLTSEVMEMEDKWINYDDEETEVEIELADLIFDKLVTETSELILQMTRSIKV